MHQRTRRWICRALFVGLCGVPTLGVLGWSLWLRMPAATYQCQWRLAQQLGLGVQLDQVHYPRPGVMVCSGLKLRDPELGRMLAKIDRVEATTVGPSLRLRAGTVALSVAALDDCWQLVDRRLRVTSATDLQVAVDRVTWRDDQVPRQLTDVKVTMQASLQGSEAVVDGHVAGDQPVRIRWVRNRQHDHPAMAWEIETGRAPLPCSLVATMFPAFAPFGVGTHFRGSLRATRVAGEYRGEVVGELAGLDMEALLSERFPYRLTGHGRIAIHRARFRGGRLEEATISLLVGPGEIERELIVRGSQLLAMRPAVRVESLNVVESYDQLGLAVYLGPQGIVLRGICDGSTPGTLLKSRFGPLVMLDEPQHPAQPVASLLTLLARQGEKTVPVAASTQRLAAILPLPSSTVRQVQHARPVTRER